MEFSQIIGVSKNFFPLLAAVSNGTDEKSFDVRSVTRCAALFACRWIAKVFAQFQRDLNFYSP